MNRMLLTAAVGVLLATGLTLGLGWGLARVPDGDAQVVPPMFAAGMLAIGLVLIGAGFYRRN